MYRWTLAALVLLLLLAGARSGPPEARSASAAPDEFSAARAGQILSALVGDGAPHPLGSAAHDRLREAILQRLRQLGYAPEVQRSFVCNPYGTCATVSNIIASAPGREAGAAVLLACHYDSVAAGPGAGDDGAGVAAALEIARVLKAQPPRRHPVILLIDDGEEVGLLGAVAFAQHPLMASVRAVVNIDARGTSGPSVMFETSHDNAWLVRLLAAALPRPLMTSVFATIYERLPNDTDLSVFKEHGVAGVNFAYLGAADRYHTRADRVEDLDPRTLQHQGDNALAMVRALADADLASPAPGRAVFFDVLALGVVSWPEPWTLPLALLGLLLLGLGAWRRQIPGGRLLQGAGAVVLIVTGAGLAGFGMRKLLAASGALPAERGWIAHPAAALGACWLLGLAVSSVVALRRSGSAGLWFAAWLWWALLGVGLAALLPGVSYLCVVPALVAGAVGVWGGPWARALPLLVAAVLGVPLLLLLYDALGGGALPVLAASSALLLATLAPLQPVSGRWRLLVPGLSAAGVLLALAVALGQPAATADRPAHLTLSYHDDGQRARWLAVSDSGAPAAFGATLVAAVPWSSRPTAFAAAAPRLSAPAPEARVLSQVVRGGERRVRVLLRSPRGAALVALVLPPQAAPREVRIGGQAVPAQTAWRFPRSGWRGFTCLTTPPEGVEFELTLSGAAPVTAYVEDRSPGLPAEGAALLRARGATAAAAHEGDVTRLTRPVVL